MDAPPPPPQPPRRDIFLDGPELGSNCLFAFAGAANFSFSIQVSMLLLTLSTAFCLPFLKDLQGIQPPDHGVMHGRFEIQMRVRHWHCLPKMFQKLGRLHQGFKLLQGCPALRQW
jgi:hypothetical protein